MQLDGEMIRPAIVWYMQSNVVNPTPMVHELFLVRLQTVGLAIFGRTAVKYF